MILKKMRNRLIMGSFRYGRLHGNFKPKFNRVESIIKRINYAETKNKELLVDIANLCLVEYEEGDGIWEPVDDGEHVTVKS